MMHEFLSENRGELIERCRMKVAERARPQIAQAELDYGMTRFLDQIIRTLQKEDAVQPRESLKMSGPSGGEDAVFSEIGAVAKAHGRELLQNGFTIDQVVHDYGDLCQAVTELAGELDAEISADEFRTLNRCLDNAIAVAATEFSAQRDNRFAEKDEEANVRLGFFAHELRNHLNTAMLAVSAMKEGAVGMTGATGAVLDRSLVGLRTLIDRSLSEARAASGMSVRHQLFSVAELIVEVHLSASLEAGLHGCSLEVSYVDPTLAIFGDRDLIFPALVNLLQNAFKFTVPPGKVFLRVVGRGDRVVFEVEDGCGGLPTSDPEELFRPFTQRGTDKTGLGLGLLLGRRSVEANQGTLTVQDLPGSGCIFAIDLPRHAMPSAPSASAPPLCDDNDPALPPSRLYNSERE